MCVSANIPKPPAPPAIPAPPPLPPAPSPLTIDNQLSPVSGSQQRQAKRVGLSNLRRDLTIPTSTPTGLNIPS